jgi:hypothetical protein
MGIIREKTMTRGVLLFAFNNDKVDYYSMAVATAKRANKFLNLPVTVVTDKTTDLSKYTYQFDNVIIVEDFLTKDYLHYLQKQFDDKQFESKNFIFRADYKLHEFTTYIFKN